MPGALSGLRVIDFGQYLAGPLTAMMLADNGADVIRVDPPGGPRWRHPVNAALQRGKRSIVLDLKSAEDLEAARRLCETADVVVEGFRPGVMDRLGLGAEALLAANPRIVYCSIPGFASDDARAGLAGWEGVVLSAAAVYHESPRRSGAGPIYSAMPFASSFAAFIAAHSIVAALIARERGCGGQLVEVALFDAVLEMLGHFGERVPGRPPPRDLSNQDEAHLDTYQCADGRWVNLSMPERRFAARFLPPEALAAGMGDVARIRADKAVNKALRSVLTELFRMRPAAEWERMANEEVGSGLGVCQSTAFWLREDAHARDSGSVIALDDPELGATAQAGYAVTLSRTPAAASPRHALDADRAAILAEIGAASTATSVAAANDAPTAPLAGVKVIDVSQVIAGPTAGRILAEYGADVVKINNPRGNVTNHLHVNAGKRTMLLNLKSPEGLDVLSRLLADADVLHQNFALGVADQMGVGEEQVRARKADIVYSSVSCHAFGGRRAGYRGHDNLGQAVTGMQVRWGGDDKPMRTKYSPSDYTAGHLSAFGIMLGLYHRLRTGEGQHVRTSLSQGATYMQLPFMVAHEGRVWDEAKGQHARGRGPLYRLHQASDRWFFLAALGDEGRQRLGGVSGLEGVADIDDRALDSFLEARFATETADVWVERLTKAGVAAHVLNEIDENMESESLKRRGLSIEREHIGLGLVRGLGPPRRLSKTPPRPGMPAAPPGWHSREILDEVGLGDRWEDYSARGIVGETST